MNHSEIRMRVMAYTPGKSLRQAIDEVADDAGVPAGTLTATLYGHNYLAPDRVQRLADALGCEFRNLECLLSVPVQRGIVLAEDAHEKP